VIRYDDRELKEIIRKKEKEFKIEEVKESKKIEDPMKKYGIMTLNHLIPYKKPILK